MVHSGDFVTMWQPTPTVAHVKEMVEKGRKK